MKLTKEQADAVEEEMRRLETDKNVSKTELRLFMQIAMPCGHAAGNLLTCSEPPWGCVICNSDSIEGILKAVQKTREQGYDSEPVGMHTAPQPTEPRPRTKEPLVERRRYPKRVAPMPRVDPGATAPGPGCKPLDVKPLPSDDTRMTGCRVLIDDKEVTPSSLIFQPARKRPVTVGYLKLDSFFTVLTLEGTMEGHPGDYLIKGVEGELYPCKKEIFEKTYDILDNTASDSPPESSDNLTIGPAKVAPSDFNPPPQEISLRPKIRKYRCAITLKHLLGTVQGALKEGAVINVAVLNHWEKPTAPSLIFEVYAHGDDQARGIVLDLVKTLTTMKEGGGTAGRDQ